LAAAGLDVIKVTIWGLSLASLRASVPGCPDDMPERQRGALFRLKEAPARRSARRIRTVLHMPVNRHNLAECDAVVNLAAEAGASALSLSPFWPRPGGDSDSLTDAETADLLSGFPALRRRLARLGLAHNLDAVEFRFRRGPRPWENVPCAAAWYHARIRTDGSVQPCGRCETVFGSAFERPFREVWAGAPISAFREAGLADPESLAASGGCDCAFCCYVHDNWRVHRVFRFLSPFRRRAASAAAPAGA
jgi:MoaA/NifB/PqqE/SkfB family radical SAM enzyme